MHMDLVMEQVLRMRMEDPVRYRKLIAEGEAIELGYLGLEDSRNRVDAEKLKSEYFPEDPSYAAVSQGVLDGKRKDVETAVRKLLDSGKDPVDVVTHALMPGIQVQCEMYDLGKAFVPEILMSNDAMQAGIKMCQMKQGDVPSKGNVASFVAEGDLHDIGKNICAAIMRANGYNVVDLGRDVPASKVLEAVRENGIQLVCGSTLMSTTKKGLVDTAGMLETEKTGVSVACGGAAVSKAFVDTFGNAVYTKTPLETVHVAVGICSEDKRWTDFRRK